MTDPAVERRIETTAWSTILLGLLCLFLAAVEVAGPILLRRLDAMLGDSDDPTRAMREAFSAGAATSAWVNGVFGAALIVIGIALWRRTPWSHRALTIACWASIAVLAALAKPTLAPLFALGGAEAVAGWSMLVVSAVLLVGQIGAVIWFLRFWLKPEVRRAFH
jgi:hypothetical protein